MEKLNDLRYVIGLFFTIVGVLLVFMPYISTTSKTFGADLNLFAGASMLVLGIALLWASGKKT
jgi:drug/metabolite transporter (DMT)-like permease